MAVESQVAELIGRLTANEKLLDFSIRHAVFLEQFKGGVWRRMLNFLEGSVYPDIVSRLESRLSRVRLRGFDSGAWTTQRFRDLRQGYADLITQGASGFNELLKTELQELAVKDANWAVNAMKRATPIDIDFNMPTAGFLKSIVTSRPMAGKTMQDLISKDWKPNTIKRIDAAVKLGLAQGQTTDEIVRRIRGTQARSYEDGILAVSSRQAKTIVRTAVTHVSSHAREATYAENSDVIDGLVWVATLDTKTCLVCGKLDGKLLEPGIGPRPPHHPNCRCSTAPKLKSWKQLGIDLKEAPEGTRASMDGQVPRSMTYEEWIGKQSLAIQNEALGPRRAELLRQGDVQYAQFVDRAGRTETLDQLAEKFDL